MSAAETRRVFFDTNVLVYSHDISTPEKCTRAKSLMNEAFIKNIGVVSGQVLGGDFRDFDTKDWGPARRCLGRN